MTISVILPLPYSNYPSGEPPYLPHVWNSDDNVENMQIKASHNCYTYMMNDLFKVPRLYGKPQPGFFTDALNLMKQNNLLNANRLSCPTVRAGVIKDNPNIRVLSIKEGVKSRAPPNSYKGIMILSPGNDYHFARQDNRLIPVYRRLEHDVKHKNIVLHKGMNKVAIAKIFLKYFNKYAPEIILLAHKTYPHLMQSKRPVNMLKAVHNSAFTWSHKPGATNATDKDADGELIVNPLTANWNYSKKGGINYNVHCCFFHIPANYYKNTYSSGVSKSSDPKNNIKHIRNNISKEHSVDSKFEALLMFAYA